MTKDADLALQVAEAADAYLAALERGDRVAPAEFLAQFPSIEAVLPDVLAAIDCIHDLADSSAETPLEAPTEKAIGDFLILREVGRGGMGVVYEAEQITLGRRVALKLLPLAGGLDSRQLARFRNEAQAAAQLHHPHIVPVYAIGQDRGMHFYAMQFIEGASLAELIAALVRERDSVGGAGHHSANASSPPVKNAETEPLAILSTLGESQGPNWHRTVARLGVEAADALQFAHDHGIVHRDIKPSNLLIDASGRLWVTDFGLAQLPEGQQLTHTGDLLGTLRYMSPEQAAGQLVDPRTDIYSLGATLYELLALRPAFAQSSRPTLLQAVANQEPLTLRAQDRTVPAELETIVLKAMAKAPAERYDRADELRDDLARFLEHRPILARPPTLLMRLRKWARRHRAIVTSVLGVGAAATVLAVALLVNEQQKTAKAYRDLSQEQGRTRAALATANLLRGRAERQFDLARRAVEFVRVRQDAIYQVHQLQGKVSAVPGGPDWLRDVVNEDPAKHFQQVTSIALEPDVGSTDLKFLAPLTELEVLDIRGSKGFRLEDGALLQLAGLGELRFLFLSDLPTTGAGFPELGSLPKLESLMLQGTQWNDAALERMDFRRCPQLGSLSLASTAITDAGTAGLEHLQSAFFLELAQTKVGDRTVARIARLPQLTFLVLKATQVTDGGLAPLRELPALKDLYLNGCAIGDQGLEHVGELEHLTTLGISGTKVTAAGVAKLRARRPKLEIVWEATPPASEK